MKALRGLAQLLPVLAVFALWEGVARSGAMSEFLLPRFSAVMARILEDARDGLLVEAVLLTCYRAVAGFGLAALIGVTVGVAMAGSRIARWFFEPVISVGFPTPKIAFLPIFMLWLGLGDASKVAIAALACVFIIATNTYLGAAGVDRQFLWAARSLGASRTGMLRDVVLPAALPQVLTGFQIALPIALITTLVAEMIMGGGGLGGLLLDSQRFADSVGLFAGIVEIAALGTLLIRGLALLRRLLLHWHAEARPVTS
jgi:ABC-type nitrate/sulfonate/bicarbonate transport system permease component